MPEQVMNLLQQIEAAVTSGKTTTMACKEAEIIEQSHVRSYGFGPKAFTLPGHSVFYKNAQGETFRTYGTFGRGSEQYIGIYGFFDVLPKDREEYLNGLVDWAKAGVQHSTSGTTGRCGCGLKATLIEVVL